MFWGLLFIIASNFFSTYQVQFVGETVDEIKSVLESKAVDKSHFLNTILINGSIIVGFSLLAGFFTFMMRQTIIVASRKIEYELKNKIYKHYQELSLSTYKKTTIGDLMNRLSEDVVAIRMYLGPGIMYIINLFFLVLITSIYMFKTDVQMTLWTLVPLPILSYLIYKVSSVINKKSKIMQKSQSCLLYTSRCV